MTYTRKLVIIIINNPMPFSDRGRQNDKMPLASILTPSHAFHTCLSVPCTSAVSFFQNNPNYYMYSIILSSQNTYQFLYLYFTPLVHNGNMVLNLKLPFLFEVTPLINTRVLVPVISFSGLAF